jgi:outer membrane protein, heavy metal efflux system
MFLDIRAAARVCAVATLTAALVHRTAAAEEPPAGRLHLADVLAIARSNNPEILAARARARAAESGPTRARAWDDPVVSWEAWNTPNNLNVAHADNNIFRLAQRIPFPGKRGLAAASAGDEAHAMAQSADAVALDVEAAVKRAYWSLWQAHQRIVVYERQRQLAERFAKAAEGRYATGGAPQADVLRAQVELTHAATDVQTGALAIDTTRAGLNALLSRLPGDPLGVPEDAGLPEPPTTSDALIEAALAQRPELAAQGATVAREQHALELARKAYLPDFELSVGRFVNYGTRDGFGAMASVTVPIANKPKYDAGISEATARITSAEADRRRLEDGVRRDVEQAWLRVRTAKLRHDLFASTHVPQAEQAMTVTEAAYASGGVDLLSLLDTLRAVESVHLEHIDSAAETQMAWAELERAVGGPVPDESPTPGAVTPRGAAEGRRHG